MDRTLLRVLPLLGFLTTPLGAVQTTLIPPEGSSLLANSPFDCKVEFAASVPEGEVVVTLDGKPIEGGESGKALFLSNDGGTGKSAWIRRGLRISAPGEHLLKVKVGTAETSARWDVWTSQPGRAPAKNVILLIGDGLSIGHRTAARLMNRPSPGRKGPTPLAMDDLDRFALVGTTGSDRITADSANTASAFLTGHKTSFNALGVWADRTTDPFDDPRQETLAEIIRRTTRKSVGVVTDTEIVDATPASGVAHTRRRSTKAAIAQDFLRVRPEVLLGGGRAWFLPTNRGGKREDGRDLETEFRAEGWRLVSTARELRAAAVDPKTERLLGLFHPENLDGVLDREILKKGTVSNHPDQPGHLDSFRAAISVLSKNPEGFFLLYEAGMIDKFTHALDWERAVYDTISFDEVVEEARNWRKRNPDTLILVTGDHTHPISVLGTARDGESNENVRDLPQTMSEATFPNYTHRLNARWPDRPDVSRRLFVTIGGTPDYWETFRPHLEGPFQPTQPSARALRFDPRVPAEGTNRAVLRTGNLPPREGQGVHSVDDLVLGAEGPGSEKIRGYLENDAIFRIMAEALGLGR